MSPFSQQIQQTKERNPEMKTTLILLLAPSNLLIMLSIVLMMVSNMFFRRAIFLNIGFAAFSTGCVATAASSYPYLTTYAIAYYAAGCVVGSILLDNKKVFIVTSLLFYILCFIALFS